MCIGGAGQDSEGEAQGSPGMWPVIPQQTHLGKLWSNTGVMRQHKEEKKKRKRKQSENRGRRDCLKYKKREDAQCGPGDGSGLWPVFTVTSPCGQWPAPAGVWTWLQERTESILPSLGVTLGETLPRSSLPFPPYISQGRSSAHLLPLTLLPPPTHVCLEMEFWMDPRRDGYRTGLTVTT